MGNILIYIMIWGVKLKYYKYWFLPTGVIYTQAKHETGNFGSDIYKEQNNLFGMKESSRDFDKGTRRGHAVFNSKLDSIKDYFARQSQFKINTSNVENYISQTVESGYAEDTSYSVKWYSMYTKRGFKNHLSLLLMPATLILIYIIYRIIIKK